jgi:hypothetical protein
MNGYPFPTTQAERVILDELYSLKKELEDIKDATIAESIEELSLYKVSRLLRLGSDKIIKAVDSGKLRAITYRDRKHKKRFRFRLADIRQFQKQMLTNLKEEYGNVESSESIAKRIFGEGR